MQLQFRSGPNTSSDKNNCVINIHATYHIEGRINQYSLWLDCLCLWLGGSGGWAETGKVMPFEASGLGRREPV